MKPLLLMCDNEATLLKEGEECFDCLGRGGNGMTTFMKKKRRFMMMLTLILRTRKKLQSLHRIVRLDELVILTDNVEGRDSREEVIVAGGFVWKNDRRSREDQTSTMFQEQILVLCFCGFISEECGSRNPNEILNQLISRLCEF